MSSDLFYQEVKTFRISKICPNCHKDFMLPTGKLKTSPDIQVEHQCGTCSHIENYKTKYPEIGYGPLDGETWLKPND